MIWFHFIQKTNWKLYIFLKEFSRLSLWPSIYSTLIARKLKKKILLASKLPVAVRWLSGSCHCSKVLQAAGSHGQHCAVSSGNINISIITQTSKTTERQHSLQFSLPKFHARAFSCQSIFCIWNPICKDMLEIKLLYFTQVLYRYTELFLCVRLSYKEGLIIMNSHTFCFSWKVSSIIYERLLYLL